MTTVAHTPSGLEVTNTDAMDLLSDAGYDISNDIDLELEDSNPQGGDDDLSLQDAGTDGASDLRTGDHDAFMVDKEDLIEEDEINYGDLELEDVGQSPTSNSVNLQDGTTEKAMIQLSPIVSPNTGNDGSLDRPLEDDLIDYSDDEDEAEPVSYISPPKEKETEKHSAALSTTGADVDPSGDAPAVTENSKHGSSGSDPVHQAGQTNENPEDPQELHNDNDTNWLQRAHDEYTEVPETGNDDDEQYTNESQNSAVHRDHDQVSNGPNPEAAAGEESQTNMRSSAFDHEHSAQDSPLPPVTVNYDGFEYWLFKPQNPDDDGEWLLEDESLASQPFPYLFHACRARLGSDLQNGTELGLRFDHFHALELFEDCTACAYCTLKELIDVYVALQSQDGQTDPEPFYITLQFRPRVLTLVNELKNAVQTQIGLSGLEMAIAEGQTSFSNVSGQDEFVPSEVYWDEEEGEETTPSEAANVETGRLDGAMHSQQQEGATEALEPNAEAAVSNTPATQNDTGDGSAEKDGAAIHETQNNANTGATPVAVSDHVENEEEDLIDYSDEEGEEDTPYTGQTPALDASTGSSTVQGDHPSHTANVTDTQTNQSEQYDEHEPSNYDYDEGDQQYPDTHEPTEDGQNASYVYDAQTDDVEDNGHTNEETLEHDQDFQSAEYSAIDFGQDYYYEDGEATCASLEQNDFSIEVGVEPVYDPLQETAVDGQSDFNPSGHTVDLTTANNTIGVTGTEQDEAAEETSIFQDEDNADEIDYDDDDEDVPVQVAAAASSTAPAAVSSSTELQGQGSPQGQKRPLDEVDGGVYGAGESTDAKRTKL